MSKLTDELAQYLKIHNIHNFTVVGDGDVFVEYIPQNLGRGGHCARYCIVGIGFETDPEAPWYNYGAKVFNVFHNNEKSAQRKEALHWASEKFGIVLVKAQWRETWVSEQVYDAVMEKLAEAKQDNAPSS